MEIAILMFFFAIFIGVLFLGGLMWFIFRRARNRQQPPRQFSGNPNHGSGAIHDSFDSDDDSGAIYTDYSTYDNRTFENQTAEAAAQDSAAQSETTEPHAVRHEYVETSYTESSYSSYDSGASSDSGSSDSGGSSND
jgi:hypothetical protein